MLMLSERQGNSFFFPIDTFISLLVLPFFSHLRNIKPGQSLTRISCSTCQFNLFLVLSHQQTRFLLSRIQVSQYDRGIPVSHKYHIVLSSLRSRDDLPVQGAMVQQDRWRECSQMLDPLQSFHVLVCREYSQLSDPLHCQHRLLWWECSQMTDPIQSLHWLLMRDCSQMPNPLLQS